MKDTKLTIIMYHYVRELKKSRYPRIKGLDIHLFKEQLKYLKKHYNFVTVEDVIASFSNVNNPDEDTGLKKSMLPSNPVLLTFDDAYIDHFTNVFPILKKHHIQGAFYPPVKAITEHRVLDVNKIHFILASTSEDKFPYLLDEIKRLLLKYKEEFNLESFDYYFKKLAITDRFDNKETIFVKRLLQVELDAELRKQITDELFVNIVGIDEETFSHELYMSIDQLKCMADCGMHIGSHGYDHLWLGTLKKEQQKYEIEKSREFIQRINGNLNNWTISYPYGSYNDDTISLLKAYGCKLGLTTEVSLCSVSSVQDSIYKLPRLDTNDIPKNANEPANEWYAESNNTSIA